MANIYCTKCGVRGNSKCPHCRSIFGNRRKATTDEGWLKIQAQEYFETFLEVGLYATESEDRKKAYARLENHEDVRWRISFWTYDNDESTAALEVLQRLAQALPLVNLQVASCVHEWSICPGEKSSIGCGHEGPPAGTPIPTDPFADD